MFGRNLAVPEDIIIDKGGRIRFFTSGDVRAEQINELNELLKVLVRE